MRINFLGGPCSGKSTTSAWLFSALKEHQISIELVTEYVKAWACQKRQVNSFDQVYLLGKQMQYEFRFLNSGIRHIVTDSPVFLSAVYAEYYYPELDIAPSIHKIVDAYEKQYPSINIFLNRKNKPYVQEGRYQDYEQAKKIDDLLHIALEKKQSEGWNVKFIDYNDRARIIYELSQMIPELKRENKRSMNFQDLKDELRRDLEAKPFRVQFTECTKAGLTEDTLFFSFDDYPEFLPAFPNKHMVNLIKEGKWKGNDFIVCGKFGGICSSGNASCRKLRGLLPTGKLAIDTSKAKPNKRGFLGGCETEGFLRGTEIHREEDIVD